MVRPGGFFMPPEGSVMLLADANDTRIYVMPNCGITPARGGSMVRPSGSSLDLGLKLE